MPNRCDSTSVQAISRLNISYKMMVHRPRVLEEYCIFHAIPQVPPPKNPKHVFLDTTIVLRTICCLRKFEISPLNFTVQWLSIKQFEDLRFFWIIFTECKNWILNVRSYNEFEIVLKLYLPPCRIKFSGPLEQWSHITC